MNAVSHQIVFTGVASNVTSLMELNVQGQSSNSITNYATTLGLTHESAVKILKRLTLQITSSIRLYSICTTERHEHAAVFSTMMICYPLQVWSQNYITSMFTACLGRLWIEVSLNRACKLVFKTLKSLNRSVCYYTSALVITHNTVQQVEINYWSAGMSVNQSMVRSKIYIPCCMAFPALIAASNRRRAIWTHPHNCQSKKWHWQ